MEKGSYELMREDFFYTNLKCLYEKPFKQFKGWERDGKNMCTREGHVI